MVVRIDLRWIPNYIHHFAHYFRDDISDYIIQLSFLARYLMRPKLRLYLREPCFWIVSPEGGYSHAYHFDITSPVTGFITAALCCLL